MIVHEWPRTITTSAGVICNPTPEQCMEAGYEMYIPPTAEEIEEARLAEEARAEEARLAELARTAEIEALRDSYRNACNQFCQVAGIASVDKFESAAVIQAQVEIANSEGNSEKIITLMQIAMSLQNSITELRRKDGDDAWLRI